MSRALTVLLVAAAGLLAPAPALAQRWIADGDVRLAVAAEEARGHLLVSRDLWARGQRIRAGLHAAHPVQEIGAVLYRPVKAADPELGRRVQAALKQAGQALDAGVSPAAYAAVVDEVSVLLDRAVARVVPEAKRRSPGFHVAVLRGLLAEIAYEYEEAVQEGRVTQAVEFQDAHGFFQRARTRWAELARLLAGTRPDMVREVERHLATLTRALPSVEPPPVAVSNAELAGAAQGAAAALGTLLE